MLSVTTRENLGGSHLLCSTEILYQSGTVQLARAVVSPINHKAILLLLLQLSGPFATKASAPARANIFLQCTALTHTQITSCPRNEEGFSE